MTQGKKAITNAHSSPQMLPASHEAINSDCGILTALIIFSFSYNKGEGITPASMVLVGVGMATALSGGSLTLMSNKKWRK